MQGRQFVDGLKKRQYKSSVSNPDQKQPNQKRSKETNKKHTTTTPQCLKMTSL